MVRHGESEWNQLNLFCGWFDAGLSEKGKLCDVIKYYSIPGQKLWLFHHKRIRLIYFILNEFQLLLFNY